MRRPNPPQKPRKTLAEVVREQGLLQDGGAPRAAAVAATSRNQPATSRAQASSNQRRPAETGGFSDEDMARAVELSLRDAPQRPDEDEKRYEVDSRKMDHTDRELEQLRRAERQPVQPSLPPVNDITKFTRLVNVDNFQPCCSDPKNLFNRIYIVKGDITSIAAGAIVNAANNMLKNGTGVTGAIFTAAGEELPAYIKGQKIANKLPIPTGGVLPTPGFKLPAPIIIHAVGPKLPEDEANAPILLQTTYVSIMDFLSQKYPGHSVAIPCISTGAFGFTDTALASRIAVRTVLYCLGKSNPKNPVMFCVFDDAQAKQYQDTVKYVIDHSSNGYQKDLMFPPPAQSVVTGSRNVLSGPPRSDPRPASSQTSSHVPSFSASQIEFGGAGDSGRNDRGPKPMEDTVIAHNPRSTSAAASLPLASQPQVRPQSGRVRYREFKKTVSLFVADGDDDWVPIDVPDEWDDFSDAQKQEYANEKSAERIRQLFPYSSNAISSGSHEHHLDMPTPTEVIGVLRTASSKELPAAVSSPASRSLRPQPTAVQTFLARIASPSYAGRLAVARERGILADGDPNLEGPTMEDDGRTDASLMSLSAANSSFDTNPSSTVGLSNARLSDHSDFETKHDAKGNPKRPPSEEQEVASGFGGRTTGKQTVPSATQNASTGDVEETIRVYVQCEQMVRGIVSRYKGLFQDNEPLQKDREDDIRIIVGVAIDTYTAIQRITKEPPEHQKATVERLLRCARMTRDVFNDIENFIDEKASRHFKRRHQLQEYANEVVKATPVNARNESDNMLLELSHVGFLSAMYLFTLMERAAIPVVWDATMAIASHLGLSDVSEYADIVLNSNPLETAMRHTGLLMYDLLACECASRLLFRKELGVDVFFDSVYSVVKGEEEADGWARYIVDQYRLSSDEIAKIVDRVNPVKKG